MHSRHAPSGTSPCDRGRDHKGSVDDGKPQALTTFNSFMAERTFKAQKAEGAKLVGELRKGNIAHVQY